MTALEVVAPSLGTGAPGTDHYYRICLTTNTADDGGCENGLLVGLWPDARIYTVGTCDGEYVGGESTLTVYKDGVSIRTCSGSASAFIGGVQST